MLGSLIQGIQQQVQKQIIRPPSINIELGERGVGGRDTKKLLNVFPDLSSHPWYGPIWMDIGPNSD